MENSRDFTADSGMQVFGAERHRLFPLRDSMLPA
jgi:hypothetical protein